MAKTIVVYTSQHVQTVQLYTKKSYVSLAPFRSIQFVYAFIEESEDLILLK